MDSKLINQDAVFSLMILFEKNNTFAILSFVQVQEIILQCGAVVVLGVWLVETFFLTELKLKPSWEEIS